MVVLVVVLGRFLEVRVNLWLPATFAIHFDNQLSTTTKDEDDLERAQTS
jgi:hypothetical protein